MRNLRYISFIIFFLSHCCSCVLAQDTYSRSFDVNVGINNRPDAFLLIDDKVLVASTHSGDVNVISSLSTFSIEGEFLKVDTLDNFIFGGQFPIVETEEGYEVMGTKFQTDGTGARGIYLTKLDKELSVKEKKLVYFQEYFSSNPRGIYQGEEYKVIYAGLVNKEFNRAEGYIGFFDEEQDTITNEILLTDTVLPYSKYFINSFQETQDGNFAFIRWIWQQDTFPGLRFEVVKMNMEGEELGRIDGGASEEQPGLLQDENGDFYFYTEGTPFTSGIISVDNSLGGIAKANSSLDSVIWSFPLNENATIISPGTHDHLSFGITNLKDGNLLTYGEARDLNQSNFAGYLCKFSQEGEILWRHYYNPEVDSMYLAENTSGFKTAGVKQCQELEDGRILCLGTTIFNRADTIPQREIWLLLVDENGCVYDDCKMSVDLPVSSSSVLPNQSGRIYPNPVTDMLQIADVSFDRYVISDMMGRTVLEGGFSTNINLPSRMPSGMYILQLVEDGRLKAVFKFNYQL